MFIKFAQMTFKKSCSRAKTKSFLLYIEAVEAVNFLLKFQEFSEHAGRRLRATAEQLDAVRKNVLQVIQTNPASPNGYFQAAAMLSYVSFND